MNIYIYMYMYEYSSPHVVHVVYVLRVFHDGPPHLARQRAAAALLLAALAKAYQESLRRASRNSLRTVLRNLLRKVLQSEGSGFNVYLQNFYIFIFIYKIIFIYIYIYMCI